MRGKLRDKRPETKRENFKRASLERRHTTKRDSRSLAVQLHQQYEQENDYNLDDEESLVESIQK